MEKEDVLKIFKNTYFPNTAGPVSDSGPRQLSWSGRFLTDFERLFIFAGSVGGVGVGGQKLLLGPTVVPMSCLHNGSAFPSLPNSAEQIKVATTMDRSAVNFKCQASSY